jgi:WD40 repeat protein
MIYISYIPVALKCNVAVTAVAWQPGSDFLLAVGDESGSISLVDTRENKNVLATSKPFQHSIFKLRFSPYR